MRTPRQSKLLKFYVGIQTHHGTKETHIFTASVFRIVVLGHTRPAVMQCGLYGSFLFWKSWNCDKEFDLKFDQNFTFYENSIQTHNTDA